MHHTDKYSEHSSYIFIYSRVWIKKILSTIMLAIISKHTSAAKNPIAVTAFPKEYWGPYI